MIVSLLKYEYGKQVDDSHKKKNKLHYLVLYQSMKLNDLYEYIEIH